MASIHSRTEAEKFFYGSGSSDNQARKVCFGFGSQPRPKATLFGLTLICISSGIGTKYQNQLGLKTEY